MFGDNRPFNVALVFPDWDLVRSWAESKAGATPGMSHEHLASLEGVRNLISGEIAISLDGFKKYEVGVVVRGGKGRERGLGDWEGGGAYSFAACLSLLTVDHASLSRRSTVSTPSGDTVDIGGLFTCLPYITYVLHMCCIGLGLAFLLVVFNSHAWP